MVRVVLSDEDMELADRLAFARLHEASRRQSPDRPTARNPKAQFRGAAGEIACRKWLEGEGFILEGGFLEDRASDADLVVSGVSIEVMTAQVAHRAITGFCVPPNKLAAARRRNAWGYLFAGTGGEDRPNVVEIQGGVRSHDVDLDPARETRVSERSPSVLNFVVRPESLLLPGDVVVALRQRGVAALPGGTR